MSLSGRCHCGAVSFSVADSAVGVINCHCRDCQQLHGNFNAMAGVPREALNIEGETLVWYESSDKARRGSCGACGSRLFKDNLGSERMMVSMGAFDASTGLRNFKNIWVESKGAWYDLPTEEPANFQRG